MTTPQGEPGVHDFVTYIPTGFWVGATAYRSALRGTVRCPFPIFWGVSKN